MTFPLTSAADAYRASLKVLADADVKLRDEIANKFASVGASAEKYANLSLSDQLYFANELVAAAAREKAMKAKYSSPEAGDRLTLTETIEV